LIELSAALRPREGETPADVARRAARLGFRGVSIGFDHRWTDSDLIAIRQAFDEAGVHIVELGCYCNFVTPREDEAQRNLARLQKAIQAGALLNCDRAVTYAGSRGPDPDQPFAPDPENWTDPAWDLMVARIWALLDSVEDLGVALCFEPAPTTTLNSLDCLAELVADVATWRVRIALDPAAIFTPDAAEDSRRALAEIFARLADTIVVARATDVAPARRGPEPTAVAAPLGRGVLHYETYLQLLDKLELDTPLVVKHMGSDAEYTAARQFLMDAAEKAGVKL